MSHPTGNTARQLSGSGFCGRVQEGDPSHRPSSLWKRKEWRVKGWNQGLGTRRLDLFPGFLLTYRVTPGQSVSLCLSLPDTLN